MGLDVFYQLCLRVCLGGDAGEGEGGQLKGSKGEGSQFEYMFSNAVRL